MESCAAHNNLVTLNVCFCSGIKVLGGDLIINSTLVIIAIHAYIVFVSRLLGDMLS